MSGTPFALAATPLAAIELTRAAARLSMASFVRALPYALVPVVLVSAALIAWYFSFDVEAEVERLQPLFVVGSALVLCPALFAPLLVRVHAIAHGQPVAAGAVLGRGVRCLLPCAAGAALYSLAVGAGTVALVLPGLFLSVALSLWWHAAVIDGAGPLGALKASWRLVQGRWWHVALGHGFTVTVAICVDVVTDRTASLSDNVAVQAVASLVSLVLLSLVPICACANMVVLRHDLALREHTGALQELTRRTDAVD